MLFFGHIGITAGVVKTCDMLLSVTKPDNSYPPDSGSKIGTAIARKRWLFYHSLNRIKSRIGSVDYRLLLLGSLLPDIIDKPVWFLAARLTSDTALSGRDYAHSLLFNLVLLIAGLVFIRYQKSWLLIVSLSSFMHLIFDQIWNSPEVLLWPLLGPIPKGETTGWVTNLIEALFLYPEVYIPEIIGLVIILLFACRLIISKNIIGFLRNGVVA